MPTSEQGPGSAIGIDDSFQIDDSFNEEFEVEVEDSFNEETEVEVEVEDSFHSDSYNDLLSNNDTDIEDSGNNESYNDLLSHNKTKVDDSFNDNSDNSVHVKTEIEDSFNISAGDRSYKLDFGGHGAAAGGGAASVAFVDQSVNANIWAGDDVEIETENVAVQATGDGSWAAGDDIDYEVDASTNIGNGIAAGDDVEVNVGNTTYELEIEDSYNWTDNSNHQKFDVDIDDSFNTDNSVENEFELEIEDSFQNDQEWKTITEFDTNIEDINIAGDDVIDIDVEDVTI